MNSFALHVTGVVIAVSALAYGAHLLGISARWIGIGVTTLLSLGIMGASVKTRRPQSF